MNKLNKARSQSRPQSRPLWQTLSLIVFGCGLASVGLGVGLSVVINQGLAQAGNSGLDMLFQGSENPAPSQPGQP
jgi:hypothetical protein